MARGPFPKHQSDHEPVRSILELPLEIQSEIFTHAHRDNSNEASRLPVEVVLSHVCSEWRNIAINLPTLWTAFKFDSHLRVSSPAKKLKEYLYRSGTQLLELYFSFSTSDYEGDPDLHYYKLFARDFALVEIAITHACRWHRFTLFADDLIPSFKFIDRFDELYVPNLEYLALCLSTRNFALQPSNVANAKDRESLNPSILTGGAPRLHTIRIDATTPFHSLPPLSNITTLAIQGARLDSDGYVQFQLHIFHAILRIPTLTNLSVESWSCIEPWIYDDPANFPSIKMPSLKTLRIAQNSNILGMLSFLDAPLLETLVLHDVDLAMMLRIDQEGIPKMTTFIRPDTIALLDCRGLFSYLIQEGVNRVDTMINTLACRTTHVIISSHGCRSFIEMGSNLLDFNQYRWPRLQRITLDLSTSFDLMSYIKFSERLPNWITVRVVEPVLDEWASQPNSLMRLDKGCKLESMKVGDSMMDEPWPAPGGLFQEDGNLEYRFIWGEILRARGPKK